MFSDTEWLWGVNIGSSIMKNVPTLVGDTVHVMGANGYMGKSLYLPLNFAVTLKLF